MKDPSAGQPFGGLLREHRLAARLSQEELADRAGLSVKTISALEQGVRQKPYRNTIAALADALQLSPDARIALGRAAARRGGGSRPAGTGVVGNLQAQRTSFVGRDGEITHIIELLGRSRLVTLTGSGGIGKTRATLEAARRFAEPPWDESWFVDLAPLTGGAFIAAKIASTIQPPLTDRVETISALASALRARRALLIFDNCEQLVAEAAHAANTILAACPHITILVTSREPLKVAGEVVYRLPPLPLPLAVDLFVQRVEAADPTMTFGKEHLDVVGSICRELNGIPLAIELAAAQLPFLGLATLQARLNEHLNIPAGRRDLPARQQTVMATIRWSYDLLTREERELLCNLSIFSGGLTLDAAEIVCTPDAFDRSAILPNLLSLVHKSLVHVVPVRDGVRYTLLDSVRTFALARLREAGEEVSASRRHAQWLAAIAEDGDKRWSHMPADAYAPLISDFDNVRAAVTWSLNAPSADDRGFAGQIISEFADLWDATGRRREHRTWVETALERIDETRHPVIVARLLHALMFRAPYEPVALAAIDRVVPLLERTGDRRGLVMLYPLVVSIFAEHGKLAEAEQAFERALALFIAEEQQATLYFAALLLSRSTLRKQQGGFNEARADIAAAEAIAVSLGDRFFVVSRCWPRLVRIEHAAGNTRAALELSERLCKSEYMSTPIVATQALELATNLRLQTGDVSAAAQSARELLTRIRFDESTAHPCEYAAAVAALRGRSLTAARLLGYVQTRDTRIHFRRDALRQATYDLLCSSIQQRVRDDDRIAASAEGARLTEEAAIAEALTALAASADRGCV